jgi:uncharacterized RDD family membrane protein YckC
MLQRLPQPFLAFRKGHCPICDQPEIIANWVPLYGVRVCWMCSQAFLSRRQIAFLIDSSLLFGLALAVFSVAPSLTQDVVAVRRICWMSYLGCCLLFALKDGVFGVSPGKWITGLQVVDVETGQAAGFVQSFARNLCVSIPLISWFYIWSINAYLFAGERVGDDWAGTKVVWRKHAYALPFGISATSCRSCGYELRGNVSGRCPECGEEVPSEIMVRIEREMLDTEGWTDVK